MSADAVNITKYQVPQVRFMLLFYVNVSYFQFRL